MAKTSYTIPKRHPEKEVKVRLNLDVAMTDVLILFSLSKYATKKSLSNLNKLLDVIDMESYCINYDIYNRLVVIKHILDGRLNKDLSNMTLIRKEVEADPLVEELCTIITWADDGLTIPDVNRIQIWVDERMKYWFFEAMMPKLIDKWNRMAKTGFNTSAQDIEEMNDMMRDVVSTMQTSSLSSGLLRQFKFSDPHMEDIIRGIVEISQHPTSVLKTGMKAMNNVLGGGGFRGGKLYLFLGPSGKFKSGTLLNMADQIRNFNDQIPAFDENGRRNTILFVTMENDIALTLERVFGMYAPQVMDFTEASPDEVIDTIKNKGRFVYTDTTGIDIDIRFFGNLEISTRDLFDIIEDMKKDGSNCICLILDYLKRIESSHDCMGDEIKRAMYASNEGALINNGQITLNAENSYGMYVDDGATKASSATNNNVISTRADGAIGMYANGNNALITNNKEIIVSGGDAYGMYVNGSASKAASGINNATIEVSGENSRGMFVEGTNASITNNKTITVSGANSVGMYAKGSGATATNASGATITISATASDSFAMYAEYGGTIINNGTIIINNLTSYGMCAFDYGSSATNTDSSSAHIYVLNEDVLINGLVALEGATAYGKDPEIKPATLTMSAVSPLSTTLLATKGSKIINNGLISTDSSLDFGNSNDDSGSINIGDGASFIATSFSGDVVADSNITLNGFESKYVNENSFVGEDNGLNITSGSYLFNADKTLNEDGNTDVVMTMKEFSEVVENSSLSDFLSDNYAEKNNENLFNSLKSTQTSAEFNRNINDLFGQNMLTSLTFEDLNVLRELNFDMNNNLFAQKKGSFTLSDGISMIEGEKFGSTGQYALSGYNDGTTSIAVGLAVSDVRSDVGTKRNNKLDKNIILSMPIGHKVGGFELVSSPKLGLAYGSYERDGLNGMNYEGKLERKMFALMNEARYPMILEGMKVIPSAEFNLVGYNIKGREDKKQYSLNIDSQNHYSVESGLGLNLEKVFTPYKNSKLKLNGGIAVYKEFADPYDLKVGMSDMSGSYNLKDEKHGDKRTLVRFGAEYKVKENLDISAMIRTNIDHEYRTDTGISLKYNF